MTRTTADPTNLKMRHGRLELEVRKNSFTVRVTAQRNKIPSHIKNLARVGSFKAA